MLQDTTDGLDVCMSAAALIVCVLNFMPLILLCTLCSSALVAKQLCTGQPLVCILRFIYLF